MQLYIAIVVVAAAVLQGALGSMVYCVAALALAVVLLVRRDSLRFGVAGGALALLAVWHMVASVVSGFSGETIAAAALPLAVLVLYLAVRVLCADERASFVVSLCFLSCIVAVAGFVMYAFFPQFSWVSGKHLVFGFLYDDVSAVWFAAMVLFGFAMQQRNRFLVLAAGVNFAALLLTCSVLVVGITLVLLAVLFVARRNDAGTMAMMCYVFVGAAFAVAYYFCQDVLPAEVALLVVFALLLWFIDKPAKWLVAHKLHYVLAAIVVVGVVVGCVFSMRLQVELPTIAQIAMTQVADALSCLAARPLFGVGAGQWGFMGYQFQSSIYSGSLLPASTLQFAVEGGAVALLASLAFVGIAVVGAIREGGAPRVCAAVFVAVAYLCFPTLQYFAGMALVVALECLGSIEEPDVAYTLWRSQRVNAVSITFGTVMLVIFAFVCFFDAQALEMQSSAENQSEYTLDFTTEFVESPVWVTNSPTARYYYEQAALSLANGDLLDGEEAMNQADTLFAGVSPLNMYDIAAQALMSCARYDCDSAVTLIADEIEAHGSHSSNLFSVLQTALNSGYVSDDVGNRAVALGEAYGYEITFTPYTDEQISEYEEAKRLNDSILQYMDDSSDDSDSDDGSGDGDDGSSSADDASAE